MKFRTDYSSLNNGFEKFTGIHDCVIDRYEVKEYGSAGLERLQLVLIVSEGDYKGRWLFDSIFQREDNEGNITWDERRMQRYSAAVGIPEGTDFNTIESWLDFVIGGEVTVEVDINKDGFQTIKKISPKGELNF